MIRPPHRKYTCNHCLKRSRDAGATESPVTQKNTDARYQYQYPRPGPGHSGEPFAQTGQYIHCPGHHTCRPCQMLRENLRQFITLHGSVFYQFLSALTNLVQTGRHKII